MLQTQYLAQIRKLIDRLESAQQEAVDVAAETVAAALATGHAFFVSPLGHGNEGDLLHRAGGLLGLQPFSHQFSVNSLVAEKLHRPARALEAVRRRMADKCGILRDGTGLSEALRATETEESTTEGGRLARLTARMMLESALHREESRGAHQRLDHPETDHLPRHTLLRMRGDQFEILEEDCRA